MNLPTKCRHLINKPIKSYIFQYKLGVDISLPMVYSLTIMCKTIQKLALLGNAERKFASINFYFPTLCRHFCLAFFKERL